MPSRFIQYLTSHTSVAKPVSAISLDVELRRQFKRLQPGVVLDVGAGAAPHRQFIPATRYLRLDNDAARAPDLCCDLHAIQWESEYFDTVIATEVLEHLADPQKAVEEIRRVLKPGGVCILSTRFIYRYHPAPKDYYRFTRDSLQHLFAAFHSVEVYHHGNRVQALWEMTTDFGYSTFGKIMRVLFSPLNALLARSRFTHTNYPSGFVVYARK